MSELNHYIRSKLVISFCKLYIVKDMIRNYAPVSLSGIELRANNNDMISEIPVAPKVEDLCFDKSVIGLMS